MTERYDRLKVKVDELRLRLTPYRFLSMSEAARKSNHDSLRRFVQENKAAFNRWRGEEAL